MRRGGGPGRGLNAEKTRLPPGQEYTVFDVPGAPPLRFGPSKARFVGNDAKNTVQEDLTGSGTLYTKWDPVLCTVKSGPTKMQPDDAKL